MNMKRISAEHAVQYIQDGMKIGLGTGSTAYWAIQKIGERVKEGLSIQAVATSKASERHAVELGIPMIPFNQIDHLDLTIDGADELDSHLQLIKGGGGALLREKIVAFHSHTLIIVADESKFVDKLGRFPLPVEVIPFAVEWTLNSLQQLGCRPQLRTDGEKLAVTDNGNYIADCQFGSINSPTDLQNDISRIPGVVDHGLFIGLADVAVIGHSDGSVAIMERK
ncbi:ribose-5-phosphate isomerase RpiA [Paenibacillus sp. IHBB 10380]|uniref:ribose-5-phosphate isomerase RpiA n=1 Tax=Paenibacillus sp. IHBB 10380 TaxID=1566358 RepID=UPI0005CFDD52|nr:ribose-5-phosphate isomerase RpiA [Paenibacillus sp. IHBB 10380]AJS59322.1 ribose 5-phosphate isomerase [Paenibacillus sp. IHBB 10380]